MRRPPPPRLHQHLQKRILFNRFTVKVIKVPKKVVKKLLFFFFFKEKLNSFTVHLTRFLTVATGERP